MAKYVQTIARKHKLSFIPGGHIVTITDVFGDAKIYDKVHYTIEYIATILLKHNDIAVIELDGKVFWKKPDIIQCK